MALPFVLNFELLETQRGYRGLKCHFGCDLSSFGGPAELLHIPDVTGPGWFSPQWHPGLGAAVVFATWSLKSPTG